MILLDGKAASARIKAQIAAQVEAMVQVGGKRPHLTAILVGEDGASKTYVANKEKACTAAGFTSEVVRMPASTSEEALLAEVARLNADPDVDGFIVQLPLPGHINENRVIEAIDPRKDVDGFHPENVGRMMLGLPSFISATPFGIVTLLEEYGIETSGKHCVVLGRSNIVGRPIANLLSQKAKAGDWIHYSITDWDETIWGWSVRKEMERGCHRLGYKAYIYASTETSQKYIDRAETMMKELGIKDYTITRDIPIRHKTDQEWREWATKQKQAHPQYDWKLLFNILADEGVDGTDLHEKWHIVKDVYGVK